MGLGKCSLQRLFESRRMGNIRMSGVVVFFGVMIEFSVAGDVMKGEKSSGNFVQDIVKLMVVGKYRIRGKLSKMRSRSCYQFFKIDIYYDVRSEKNCIKLESITISFGRLFYPLSKKLL